MGKLKGLEAIKKKEKEIELVKKQLILKEEIQKGSAYIKIRKEELKKLKKGE